MSSNALPQKAYAFLGLLIAARLALGLTYSLITPIWEADNEDGHFAYARYIAQYRRLPQQGDPAAESIFQKFQAPLYYIGSAFVLAAFDLGSSFVNPELNPYLAHGDAGVNYAIRPRQPSPVEAAQAQAVLTLRVLGVAVSALSIGCVFATMRLVWPTRTGLALGVTAVYAFWPQFVFTGSMVTNDVLAAALGAVVSYLLIHLVTKGLRSWKVILLALAVGASVLTKINAIGLLPAVGVATAFALLNSGGESQITMMRRSVMAAVILVVVVVAAILWLSSLRFVRAQLLQPGTITRFFEGVPEPAELNRNVLVTAIPFMFRTSFASFGWGNVEMESWWYILWDGLAVLVGAGWIIKFTRHRNRVPQVQPALLVLAAALAGNAGLMLALALATQSAHVPGRYLLPALPGLCALLIIGWNGLFRENLARHTWKVMALGIVLASWSTPFRALAPAYALPQPMSTATQTQLDTSTATQFSAGMRLLGHLPYSPVGTNQTFLLRLCWKAEISISENYPVALEVVGPDGQGYGRLVTYPGHGNYPTGLWPTGEPFCDSYSILVRGDFPAPAVGDVRVVFLPPVSGGLAPTGEAHIPVKVSASVAPPAPAHQVDYRFGDAMRLRGYDLVPLSEGQPGLRVILQWEALRRLDNDYLVFVHLRETSSSRYYQADGPPNNGRYPTSLWEPGDLIRDPHDFIFMPSEEKPGPLALYVGLYERLTGERVPITDSQGQPVLNSEILLANELRVDIPDPFRPTDTIYLPLITHGAETKIASTPEPARPPSAYP